MIMIIQTPDKNRVEQDNFEGEGKREGFDSIVNFINSSKRFHDDKEEFLVISQVDR
jgi:hypothetical protein